jgi:hypothetical protein
MYFNGFLSLFICILVCSSLLSCNKRQNKNIQYETDTRGKRKWTRFAEFVGLQTENATLDSSSPDFVKNVYAQIPSSASPIQYFLDDYFHKSANNSEPSFYFKEDEKNIIKKDLWSKLSTDERAQYEPLTRRDQIIARVKHDPRTSNGIYDTAWQSQCADIVGMSPYVSDISFDKLQYEVDKTGVYRDNTVLDSEKKGKEISDVYVLRFRPYKDNNKNVDENDIRTALVSIPKKDISDDTLSYSKLRLNAFPLILFSHGGDSGLDFNQIHNIFQARMLKKAVVVAPTFPGEPLCAYSSNSDSRKCIEKKDGKEVEVKSLLPLIGKKEPLRTDALELLAVHNCFNRFLARKEYKKIKKLDENYNEIKSCKEIENCNDDEKWDNPLHSKLSLNIGAKEELGVSTVIIGASRGGAAVYTALGRLGFLLQEYNNSHPKFPDKESFLPSYISSAAVYYAPSSFMVGRFQYLLKAMVHKEVSETFERLPMIPELKNIFNDYYYAREDSHEEYDALWSLAADLARTDIVYLAPYIAIAIQNWRSFFSSTVKNGKGSSVPGNIALFHSIEDKVIPYTSSLIAYQSFIEVNRLLSDPEHILHKNGIPGFSYSLFTFQPRSQFYSLEAGEIGCPLSDLENRHNKEVRGSVKCFSGLSSERPYSHADEAFWTSEFANFLDPKDVSNEPDLIERFDPYSDKYDYTFNNISEKLFLNINSDKQTLEKKNSDKQALEEKNSQEEEQENKRNIVSKNLVKKAVEYLRGQIDKRNNRFLYTPNPLNFNNGGWKSETYPLKPIDILEMWFETAALSTLINQH